MRLFGTSGIRLSFTDGWLYVRASGTGPKIRVAAEARTEAPVRYLYHGALKMLSDMMGGEGGG